MQITMESLFEDRHAPVVMGCQPDYKPIKTADDLLAYKRGEFDLPEPTGFIAERLGESAEVKQLLLNRVRHYCELDLQPAQYTKGPFAAHVEGCDTKRGVWLFTHAPWHHTSRSLKMAERSDPSQSGMWQIPDHIRWQMVHQAACLPSELHTVIYAVHSTVPGLVAPEWLAIGREELEACWPTLEAKWQPLVDEYDRYLADSLDAAEAELAAAEAQVKMVRSQITAGGERIVGNRRVSHITTIGPVDYTKLLKDYGISKATKEAYRKQSSTSVRIVKIKAA